MAAARGAAHMLHEIEQSLRLRLGETLPGLQAQLKFAGFNLDFSIAKARTKLGYTPRVLFDEGMKQATDWYKASRERPGEPGS